jgi:predicted phage-related endonuclease
MAEDIIQGSAEWFALRAGKLTASRFVDVIALTKAGKPTAARDKYLREVVFERLAGIARHEVGSKSLNWGAEIETFAREAYQVETGHIVAQASFIVHPVHTFVGGSPDGLVASDGLIEMKCPMDEAVHIQTLMDGMPLEHMPQVQGNLLVTGRRWADFCSYDPRQRDGLRLYVQRVERDDEYIAQLVGSLITFNAEVEAMVDVLLKKAA